jgi:hypothetical protein
MQIKLESKLNLQDCLAKRIAGLKIESWAVYAVILR